MKLLYTGGALAIILAIGVIFSQVNRPNNSVTTTNNSLYTEAQETPQTINVRAENRKFDPSDFTLKLSETLVLNVNAVDDDYFFRVEGYPRLDTTIAKSKSTSINISFLGVGTYNYSCGTDCSGIITVLQESD